MSTSHRTTGATAAALASASLALLGALLAPPAAATSTAPASSTSAPAAPAPAASAPADPVAGSAPTAGAEAPTATALVVRPGDTLTAIARRAGTPGGWPALYAANRDAVGASPDLLAPGTVLVLPAAPSAGAPVGQAPLGSTPTTTYLVEPGDSLRRIAERTGAPGGWPALYAANRAAVGPDPDVLAVGVQLVLPAAAAPAGGGAGSAPPAPAPSSPQDGPGAGGSGSGPSASPSASTVEPSPAPSAAATAGAGAGAPQASGLPSWVVWPMVVVAVLALGALLGDPLLALLRRHRQQPPAAASAGRGPVAAAGAGAVAVSAAPTDPAPATAPAAAGPPVAPVVQLRSASRRRPVVHVRGYASLLVTYSAADDLVLVLAPSGQDADEALHVARVVLPDDVFRAVEAELPSALLAEDRRRSSQLGA